MTFDAYVTSVTQDKILPKVVDQILGSNVLTTMFLSNGKPWSGETLKIPVKYQKNSTSQGAFDGFDTFDTSKVNTRVVMSFNPTGYYQSIVLSGMEVDVNATSAQVLDLVKVEMESGMQDMIDSIGTIFYGVQAGKNFLGLKDYVDDTTSAASYGGLARASYSSLNATVTASATLSLTTLGTQYDAAAVGSQKPDLGITTETVWGLFESLIQPTVNANYNVQGYAQLTRKGVMESRAALQGEIGFDALFFRGMPVVKDEKCSTGYFYMLNRSALDWYGLKSHKYQNISLGSSTIEGGPYEGEGKKSYGFAWSGLKEPTNQYAEIGQLILMGNLIGKSPRLNSVQTGITGV